MKTNTMKSKLLASEAALGCSIMVPSPQMLEMVAHATALEIIDTILGTGVKYVYTHLPKLIGAGASEFLDKGRDKS